MTLPILYSFRRCPYAMRARAALIVTGLQCEMREILLSDKPAEMLKASPKGTVPVLVLPDGTVIEESFDVMLWALKQKDPEGWLDWDEPRVNAMHHWIDLCEEEFRPSAHRYKYESDPEERVRLRSIAEKFLIRAEGILGDTEFLFADRMTFGDVGVFPFVRQFSMVDPEWFKESPYPNVRRWLDSWLSSELCDNVLQKFDVWVPGDAVVSLI